MSQNDFSFTIFDFPSKNFIRLCFLCAVPKGIPFWTCTTSMRSVRLPCLQRTLERISSRFRHHQYFFRSRQCWRQRAETGICILHVQSRDEHGRKILSNELAERQVKVVNLHPGWMRTVMGGALAAQMTDLSVSPKKCRGYCRHRA